MVFTNNIMLGKLELAAQHVKHVLIKAKIWCWQQRKVRKGPRRVLTFFICMPEIGVARTRVRIKGEHTSIGQCDQQCDNMQVAWPSFCFGKSITTWSLVMESEEQDSAGSSKSSLWTAEKQFANHLQNGTVHVDSNYIYSYFDGDWDSFMLLCNFSLWAPQALCLQKVISRKDHKPLLFF